VLETDQGIRAAMAAGVRAVVVSHRLPALLACLQPAPVEADANSLREALTITQAADISELSMLQLLALKGRAPPEVLADSLSIAPDAAITAYTSLCQSGLCAKAGPALRLTRSGQERLTALLVEERTRADPAAVVALYEEFCVFNAELKQLMTAWQVKDDGSPNDHLDAVYDAVVLQRLSTLHARTNPLLQRLAQLSPRLAVYPVRLGKAHARIAAGDHGYVAKPIVDSYHTVWFELHKELISIAGLNHQAEARAGHAA
jgi:pyruvate,orthophosphate dikinase